VNRSGTEKNKDGLIAKLLYQGVSKEDIEAAVMEPLAAERFIVLNYSAFGHQALKLARADGRIRVSRIVVR
jgi:hypothetical protein